MCGRRESNLDGGSKSKDGPSRRRSSLPASELHLEVPCFAVRPAGAPASQVTEPSLPALSDGDHTEVLTDQYCTVAIPLAAPASSVSDLAYSDKEHETAAVDDSVNANVSGELADILSRAAALIETEQNDNANSTDGFRPVDSAATPSILTSMNGNGGSHESSFSTQSSSSAVPDVLSSAHSTRSVMSRGRIRRGRATVSRDRGRPVTLSPTQPSPLSVASTTADRLK